MMKKYMSTIFRSIMRQTIATATQEEQLAAYTSFDFVDRFRMVATTLSELTGRSYIDYLFEAQEMILQGESEQNTLEHFLKRSAMLQKIQEDE